MGKLGKLLLLGASGALVYTAARRRNAAIVARYYDGLAVAVTGGASGIGRALVESLVERGALVLVVDCDAHALERVRTELPVATLQLDMTAPGAPGELIEQASRRLGGLDVVFSNHGVAWTAPFLEMRHADIERQIDVNFTSHVRLTRALLPFFLERGCGVIGYTGSLSAHVGAPLLGVYSGTKGGLNQFVTAIRREMGHGCPVQLTIIHPNVTRTGLVSEEVIDHVAAHAPVQTPERVAAVFLDGVALGRKEVFVQMRDVAIAAVDIVAPAALEWLSGWTEDAEFRAKALAAMQARGGLAPPPIAGE